MNLSRPVPWVSPVLYTAVLIAGLYAETRDLGDTHVGVFLGGIAGLFALEFVRQELVALLAKAVLFVAVATADGSGLSRVLFVLVPFTAYLAFGRTISIGLGLGCVIAVAVLFQLAEPNWLSNVEYVSDLLMFALGVTIAIAMASVVVEERLGRDQIAVLSAQAERQRVARDIHDDLGHHLTAVVVLLEKAQAFRERDPAVAAQAVEDAALSARRALADVRKSVRALHFHLGAALQELAGDVTVQLAGDEARYHEEVLRALYHAAQEGITNARRHASATSITVSISLGQHDAQLTVADDGQGFASGREGFGLKGMRERINLVGGEVDVQSALSLGTRIMVIIPRQSGT